MGCKRYAAQQEGDKLTKLIPDEFFAEGQELEVPQRICF